MEQYLVDGEWIDSIELKCLVVSKGVKVDRKVYKAFSPTHRLYTNPLTCNCIFFPDDTIAQMTDMGFHLSHLSGSLSWDNLKLLRYASQLTTPFTIRLDGNDAVLYHKNEPVCPVAFPEKSAFYQQKTASGMPYIGNAVIQGVDWVAFQCLWPCEYAAAGKPCEFCFSGAEFQSCAIKNKPMPRVPSPEDVGEIVGYAMSKAGCNSVQITGGSTFQSEVEEKYITSYLEAIERIAGHDAVTGELLLYITPPDQTNVIDRYFQLGANRIACSLEVWDEERAKIITPGKIAYTTRERHLSALSYIAERYGPAKAFSNLIIGIEDFDTLKTGATYLAQRGILPTASIWMPFGRPVMGNMQAPGVDYYRRVKELFAELYTRYQLEPPATRGLNVCMERDIWRYAQNVPVHQQQLANDAKVSHGTTR